MSGNLITSVAPLGGLTNLTGLTLGNNQITDITPLEDLTGLTWLVLYGNQIESVAPVAGFTNLATVSLSTTASATSRRCWRIPGSWARATG